MSRNERPVGKSNYVATHHIGFGSFANVYKGYHKITKAPVAIKQIALEKLKNSKHVENLASEIEILKSLEHPNILRLYEKIETKSHIYLITEYCNGGDLAKVIRKRGALPEEEVRDIAIQLVNGYRYLHDHKLLHRDIKPGNLLLTSDERDPNGRPRLKIADFGFARYVPLQDMVATICGSPLYMAPELLRCLKYDASVDLWSIGIVLWELLVGKAPFSGKNQIDLLSKINANCASLRFPPHLDATLSVTAKHMIMSLLQQEPHKRLPFQQLFSHDFLTGGAPASSKVVLAPAPRVDPTQAQTHTHMDATVHASTTLETCQQLRVRSSVVVGGTPLLAPTVPPSKAIPAAMHIAAPMAVLQPSSAAASSTTSIPVPVPVPVSTAEQTTTAPPSSSLVQRLHTSSVTPGGGSQRNKMPVKADATAEVDAYVGARDHAIPPRTKTSVDANIHTDTNANTDTSANANANANGQSTANASSSQFVIVPENEDVDAAPTRTAHLASSRTEPPKRTSIFRSNDARLSPAIATDGEVRNSNSTLQLRASGQKTTNSRAGDADRDRDRDMDKELQRGRIGYRRAQVFAQCAQATETDADLDALDWLTASTTDVTMSVRLAMQQPSTPRKSILEQASGSASVFGLFGPATATPTTATGAHAPAPARAHAMARGNSCHTDGGETPHTQNYSFYGKDVDAMEVHDALREAAISMESGDKTLGYAVVLYVRALQLVRSAINSIDTYLALPALEAEVKRKCTSEKERMQSSSKEWLERAQATRLRVHSSVLDAKTPTAEHLLYNMAVTMARNAALNEMHHRDVLAMKNYFGARRIFSLLLLHEEIDAQDVHRLTALIKDVETQIRTMQNRTV